MRPSLHNMQVAKLNTAHQLSRMANLGTNVLIWLPTWECNDRVVVKYLAGHNTKSEGGALSSVNHNLGRWDLKNFLRKYQH